MKVVLDANVIISAILSRRGTPRQVLFAWEEDAYTSVISEGIIAEVEKKLQDKEVGGAYGVTSEDIKWITALLRTQSDLITVLPNDVEVVTGDPEDDYVLATTVVGRADYLVTGDKRLLALQQHRRVTILNPRAFLDIIATEWRLKPEAPQMTSPRHRGNLDNAIRGVLS